VNAGVLMAPVVPGFTTQPRRLEATIRAIAEHHAAFMGANILYLKGGTKDHFLEFLAREFPHLLEGYNRLYPRAYAPSGYVAAVRATIDALQRRYEVNRRATKVPEQNDQEPVEIADDQQAFSWDGDL
jgi:DNA repair photolyase